MKRLLAMVSFLVVGAIVGAGCGAGVVVPSASTDAGAEGGTGNPDKTAAFSVSGTVAGLLGTGLVLQNNKGDDLVVKANGAFVFPKKLASGDAFAVSVKAQPSAPLQTCSVSSGSGSIASASVTTVVVNCSPGGYTVGGNVSGLAGSGLVLQNNAGDDAIVSANGTFTFPTPVLDKKAYAVTVKTQPTNLSQTCTATDAAGTIAGANVTNVVVACVTKKFTVGGTVTGLVGAGLVLRNNVGADLAIAANGTFAFAASQDDGSDFAVTVKDDPTAPEQTCLVSGGTGKVAGGNVTSVTVNCSTKKYAVGGSIAGLAGTGLVLQNNAGDDLTVNVNGTFAFAVPLEDLSAYAVTVKTQPTNRWQTCTVTNGSGNVAAAAVTTVSVVCVTNSYKVTGTVSGLEGAGLVLQNNAGGDLPIAANGPFEFASPVASGATYLVSVLTHPTNKSQTCTVTNGAGTVAGTDVTNIAVACVTNRYTIGGTITGLASGNSVVLHNNAGNALTRGANGAFVFGTSIESGQPYAVTVQTQPTTPNQTCVVTGGTGTVVAGNVDNIAVNCTTNMHTVSGTITGLAGTGLQLRNSNNVVITANGTSFSFSAQDDGTAYAITVETQPVSPWQSCVVTAGAGTLAGANVTGVVVTCTTLRYSVGGSVAGLVGTVVLTNNGGDDKTVSANGSFAFDTTVASGASYAVAVKTRPANQFCSVTNGSGTVTNASVSNVTVTCSTCGNDCWGADGCMTAAGRCVKFGCRDANAGGTFCSSCAGWQEISYDQWMNGGYCGDVIAKYRAEYGTTTHCGGGVAATCCGTSAACAGGDNAWHFFDGTNTRFVGPCLGCAGNTNCSFWDNPTSGTYTRITACTKQ